MTPWLNTRIAPFALALACALAACQSQPLARPEGPLEARTVDGIERVHAAGEVYLAGQPSAAAFEMLAKSGVTTVIDLRKPGELKEFDERAHLKGLGVRYVNVPFSNVEELTDAQFDAVLAEMRRPSSGGLVLHCASANRVGPLWIAHRVLDQGAEFEVALAEATRIGMRNAAYGERAKAYIASRR
jgi:protein tyrosine phosphatase (PTP) superfamily phosphohydrolase (DUF442 family)